MRSHHRRVHQGMEVRKLQCDMCKKRFLCPSELRKHVERVHLKVRSNEIPCPICRKPFGDSRDMKIHLSAVHTKDTEYPCSDCKMVFYRLNDMVNHKRRMHGGDEVRKHICPMCGKGFCSKSDLRTHKNVVHEDIRKHVCNICDKAFKVASHLTYHKRKHTGETPFQCPYCSKGFSGPGSISEHVKKVHKTVYMGVAQRRKLNLPETAPLPPPGALPTDKAKLRPVTQIKKNKKHELQSSKKAKSIDKTCFIPLVNIFPEVPQPHVLSYQPSVEPSVLHSVASTACSSVQSLTPVIASTFASNSFLNNQLIGTTDMLSSDPSLAQNTVIQNNNQSTRLFQNNQILQNDHSLQNSPAFYNDSTIICHQGLTENNHYIDLQLTATNQNAVLGQVPTIVRLLQDQHY